MGPSLKGPAFSMRPHCAGQEWAVSLPLGAALLFREMIHTEKRVTNIPAALFGAQRRAGRLASWRGRVPAGLGGRGSSLDYELQDVRDCVFNLLTAVSPAEHVFGSLKALNNGDE